MRSVYNEAIKRVAEQEGLSRAKVRRIVDAYWDEAEKLVGDPMRPAPKK